MAADLRKEWARSSLQWFGAAWVQADRSRALSLPESPTEEFGQRQTELLLFVAALRNSLRGVEAVLGSGSHLLRNFKKAVPDLVNVRNMIEHYDAYIDGTGHLQTRDRPQHPWRVALSGSGDAHTFEVWYGNADEDLRQARVNVDEALYETAKLVAAATKKAGLGTSPLTDELLSPLP